jgi:RNA polymerase sigma-70 factor (ECF subfamily)
VRDDRAARFRDLFDSYYEPLVAYALRRASESEAEEVVADTWLIAWRRLDDLPAEPLYWLYGVARKVLANRRRSEGRQQALRDKLTESEPSPPSEDLSDSVAIKHAVHAALIRLSETEREVLRLVGWEGLGAQQGAQAMGWTTPVFTLRLHRARKKLLKELERAGHSLSKETTRKETRDEAT